MAKIRFGDYLKSKKSRRALYESDESIVKRINVLIEADECAVNPKYRLENYGKALELLEQIPGYSERDELLKVCLEGIDQAEEEMIQADFVKAKYHLNTASDEYEFGKASEELATVSEEIQERKETVLEQTQEPTREESVAKYDDMLREVYELKAQADAQVARLAKKTTRHRWIVLVVYVAVIAAIIYAFASGFVKYAIARLEGMTGKYESASERFYSLGDYLDSPEQYEYYEALFLKEAEEKENKKITEAEPGHNVMFAGKKWKVLEKDGTKLKMVCLKIKSGSAFFQVSYDGEQRTLEEEIERETELEQARLEEAARKESEAAAIAAAGSESTAGAAASSESEVGTASSSESVSGSKSRPETESEKAQKETKKAGFESDSETESETAMILQKGSASWKDSSLRAYLNDVALNLEFTPEEIEVMVPQTSEPTSNPQYRTKLDESTEDLITILTAEEVRKYAEAEYFRKPAVDMWLRTPGRDMESAAYLTSKGNLILFGNNVTDADLSVCPVITVDYSKLDIGETEA